MFIPHCYECTFLEIYVMTSKLEFGLNFPVIYLVQ